VKGILVETLKAAVEAGLEALKLSPETELIAQSV